MHSDITFIASDLLAAEKVQNILRESPANCQVVLSNTQDLEEVSRSQVAQGAKVLIAFGMFAKIVRQSVDVPVIMVDLQAEDVMDALLEASKLGKRIAIFGFRRVLKDVFYVRDLLSIDLVWLPTVSPEKIPHELEKVQDHRCTGGGLLSGQDRQAVRDPDCTHQDPGFRDPKGHLSGPVLSGKAAG